MIEFCSHDIACKANKKTVEIADNKMVLLPNRSVNDPLEMVLYYSARDE